MTTINIERRLKWDRASQTVMAALDGLMDTAVAADVTTEELRQKYATLGARIEEMEAIGRTRPEIEMR